MDDENPNKQDKVVDRAVEWKVSKHMEFMRQQGGEARKEIESNPEKYKKERVSRLRAVDETTLDGIISEFKKSPEWDR